MGAGGKDASQIQSEVKEYYGETLATTSDLKTNACCTMNAPPKEIRDILAKVPSEVIAKYYGCGSPLPQGIEGLHVLDLGCGSGRDCYVASKLVGPTGRVTGVDMTPQQLEVARKHQDAYASTIGYANMDFIQGTIEDLSAIPSDSIDIIISNCVVNLSPDKPAVLKEAYRVLRHGGEFYFSDVYGDRRLPKALTQHKVLVGECIGGALYEQDFLRIARRVGFEDPRVLDSAPIDVKDPQLIELVGEAKFTSVTYRLFKLPGLLESLCEDYGQVAVYKGTVPGHRHAYQLDDHHRFETGRPMLVCGNSAAMVGDSWLGKHFTVTGDRSTHFGLFPCHFSPSTDTPTPGGCASCC